MKIFIKVQQYYEILGISSSSNRSTLKCLLNNRVFFGLSLFGCSIVSHFLYTFRVANNFVEYMLGICSLSGSFILFVCFVAVAFQRTTLFECIDKIEKDMDASKMISSFCN